MMLPDLVWFGGVALLWLPDYFISDSAHIPVSQPLWGSGKGLRAFVFSFNFKLWLFLLSTKSISILRNPAIPCPFWTSKSPQRWFIYSQVRPCCCRKSQWSLPCVFSSHCEICIKHLKAVKNQPFRTSKIINFLSRTLSGPGFITITTDQFSLRIFVIQRKFMKYFKNGTSADLKIYPFCFPKPFQVRVISHWHCSPFPLYFIIQWKYIKAL